MLTSGPPELPGLIGASVWRNDSYSLISTLFRSVAEMMPVVTLWLSSNGEPTAITSSPTLQLAAVAPGQRRIARVVDLDDGDVGLGVGADDRGDRLGAVVERHGDLLRAFDDVVVRQDVAAVVVDEPRAGPAGRGRRTAPSRAVRRGRRTA